MAHEKNADYDVVLLENTNTAVVDMDPPQAMPVQAAAGGEIVSVDPELSFVTYSLEYVRGFRDAVNQMADIVL